MSHTVLTTGIGSLPFTEQKPALDYVFAAYDVPFYPQLPQRRPGSNIPLMMQEVMPPADLNRSLIDQLAAAPTLAGFYGWEPFLARAKTVPLVKMQLVGPVSLAAWLRSYDPKLPAEPLKAACWNWIEQLTMIIAAALPCNAWLLWDDGLLVSKNTPSAAARFQRLRIRLAERGTRLGLHCCAPTSAKAALTNFRGAVLGLDLSVIDFADTDAERALHAQDGGLIIFGVFDTRRPSLDHRAAHQRAQSAQQLNPVLPLILSGGCGTGLHPLTYEQQLGAGLKMVRSSLKSSLL